MPIYAYRCPECGASRDAFNRVSDRHANAPECHGRMAMEIQPNMGFVQRECHYECPITGRPITTHRQRQNVMAEHDVVDANDFKPAVAHEKAKRRFDRNAEKAALLHSPVDKVLDQYRPALPTTI